MERVLPGFLTRCWTGRQDRQPAANPYRAARARAVVRLNLAFPLLSKPYPGRAHVRAASGSRSYPPTGSWPVAWRACHRRGVTESVRGITLRVRTTRHVEHR